VWLAQQEARIMVDSLRFTADDDYDFGYEE
jgi:hypothetical protein